ncbi:MAG: hypothetical protein P9M14_05695 [Candidatus Alcyoniella australis]|nr:hypothetical protein [Candidatus Alcyoniella australis]
MDALLRRFAVAAILTIGAGVLYLALPSAEHHPDGIVNIAAMAERFGPLHWFAFLRVTLPSHILYDIGVVAVWKLLTALGYGGRALYALSTIQAVLAAAGVGLFFLTLERALGDRLAALVCSAGLAVSGGYWMYAANLEDILPSVILFVLAYRLALWAMRTPGLIPWELCGIVAGISTLAHNTSLMLCGSIAVLACHRRRGCLGRLAAYSLGLVGSVYFSLAFLGRTFVQVRGPRAMLDWMMYIHNLGLGGKADVDLPQFARTVAGALVYDHRIVAIVGASACAVLLIWAIVRVAKAQPERSPVSPRLIALSALIWVVPMLGFAAYWNPRDVEFVAPALPAVWLLLAVGATPPRGRRPYLAAIAGLALLLLAANLIFCAIPQSDPQNVRSRRMADALAQRIEPGALLITPTVCWASVEFAYFHPQVEVLELGLLRLKRADRDEFERELNATLQGALERQRTVYLHTWPDRALSSWRRLESYGTDIDRIAAIFESNDAQLDFCLEQEKFYRVSSPKPHLSTNP